MSLDAEMEMPEMEEETGTEETGDVDVPPMNTDAEIAMNEEPEEEFMKVSRRKPVAHKRRRKVIQK
jgi:hypothetical protein